MSLLHLVFGRLTVESLPFWEMLHYPTRQNLVRAPADRDRRSYTIRSAFIETLALLSSSFTYGMDREVKLGLLRLDLFWYFLDIVWVAIFSFIYLGGLA
ncbi:MAG: hypothetical protein ACREV7_00120 [Steroidobacteraceae bacterium]